jgi:isopentenyl diphosphate isomerase/L-lactate dehydrogenase-like FMN-dependent dehydrogenase
MNAPLAERFLTLQEIYRAAERNLAPGPWAYLIGGAETETTVLRNRRALDEIAFRPRVLRDVSRIDTAARFLGKPVRLPLFLAPIGGLESIVEGGAATAARAAAEFGVPQMLSSVCKPGLEQTAAAANTVRVFQLYVRGDDAWVDDWVRRAKANGYCAFCLTVDVAVYSRRERDLLGRFAKPWRARAPEGAPFQAGLSWKHVARFKDKHPDVPLIIKGIATTEDAELAVEHGVQVVYVSNHGGRQLDHGLGSAAVLPAIVQAVRDRAEVWVDGGFMRGTDVVKALALGAKAVGIGRLTGLALAAAGAPSLVRALEIMEDEVRTCLGLLGVTSYAELTSRHLASAPAVRQPDTFSAFPLPAIDAPPIAE